MGGRVAEELSELTHTLLVIAVRPLPIFGNSLWS